MKNPSRKNNIKTLKEIQAEVKWLEEQEKKLVGISTTRPVPYKAFQNTHEALCEARRTLTELNKPTFVKRLRKVVRK